MKRSRPAEAVGAASAPKPRAGRELYAQGTSARAAQVGEKRRWGQRQRQESDQM